MLTGLAALEEGQGNDVALGDVAGVVDVEVVATVVGGQDLCGMVWVADGLVEIDYTVEFAASPNPGVDLLADLLALGAVEMIIERVPEEGVLEGGNRRADDADSFFVSASDELTIAFNQVLSGHAFGLRYERTREKHVVDAKSEDGVSHAGLREDVAIEACDAMPGSSATAHGTTMASGAPAGRS